MIFGFEGHPNNSRYTSLYLTICIDMLLPQMHNRLKAQYLFEVLGLYDQPYKVRNRLENVQDIDI